jgi:DNA-binding CsgD family transcriptional regulator
MVMPRRELRRTEFFNDFLVPQQMESMLNTVVLVEEGRQTVVTVRRNREFGADHVKLYKLLAPHLQRAMQINIKLAKAELNHIWSVAALNHLEDGILFVDMNAKVRFANSAAEMFFLSRDIRMHKGRLSANSAAETESLHAVIAKCSERGIPLQSDFVWLRRQAGRSPLCLLIAPLPVEGASLLMSSLMSEQPMAVIFVKDPDKNNRPTLPQLREKFGMTLAEAGFAIEISKGDGIQAAADRLSISRATARTHLSRIFDKTGTRRQAELVRVLISTSTPGAMNL